MSTERNPREDFENLDSSLSQYFDLVDRAIEDPESIFDDILDVEQRYQNSTVINQGGVKRILKCTDSLTDRPVAKATLIDFADCNRVSALFHKQVLPNY